MLAFVIFLYNILNGGKVSGKYIMNGNGYRNRGRPREFDREKALITALKIFWSKGYEPASVAEICAAMGINPPSLYAAFGNKAGLFMEAALYYKRLYWEEPEKRLMAEPDVYKAIHNYFQEAVQILLSPDAPCGCLVILGGINISDDKTEIITLLKSLREKTRRMFAERMRLAIQSGQIPPDTDVPALSGALNALLEGLSLQAREGLFLSELKAMASLAVRLLPPPLKPTHTGAGTERQVHKQKPVSLFLL